MKILQAVATSAVETLDGRQGLGLVLCSRSLPQEIRQMAKEFEHSSISNKNAIYCLRIEEISGDRWIVMNRAVPNIDYTGRTSHVSHTVAFREEELKQFFRSRNTAIPSAFEFMRNFEWRSSWNEEPKPLEDDDDLDETRTKAFEANLFDESKPLDANYLLAFDYSDTGLEQKRLAWRFNERNSEDILDIFHQAWLCLDPWQGTRKYKDLLDEPEVSMLESWQCAFTTNLLHGRPDPYDWVVLTPEYPGLASRELFEPSNLSPQTPDAIKEKIGPSLGDLLVDRCFQGPEAWAKKQLEEKIAELERRYGEQLGSVAINEKNEVANLIESLRSEIKKNEDQVSSLIDRGVGKSVKEDSENYLNGIRANIRQFEETAQKNHKNLTAEFRGKVASLKTFLNANVELDGTNPETTAETPIFTELHEDFEQASQKYKEVWQQHLFLYYEDKYNLFHLEATNNLAAKDETIKNLNSKLEMTSTIISSHQSEIAELKTKIPKPGKRKQMGWERVTLISMSALALGLAVYIGVNYEKLISSEKSSANKPTSNEESSVSGLQRQIGSQKGTISQLEKDKGELTDKNNKQDQTIKTLMSTNQVKNANDTGPLPSTPKNPVTEPMRTGADPKDKDQVSPAASDGATTARPATKKEDDAPKTVTPEPAPPDPGKSNVNEKNKDPKLNTTSDKK